MISELTPLEKIHKANYCFVWASTLGTSVRTTKKEARRLYINYIRSKNDNFRWYLEYIKSLDEYWLYIN